MKLKSNVTLLIAILASQTAFANSNEAQEFNGKQLLKNFNKSFPELAEKDNFIQLVLDDLASGKKVYFSKNYAHKSTDGKSTSPNQNLLIKTDLQCSAKLEDEICKSVFQHNRLVEFSCQCVVKSLHSNG